MLRRTELTETFDVSRDLAFAVLTDYAGYREWLAGVAEVRILASEGDVVVLEMRVPAFRDTALVLETVQSPPAEIRFREVGRYGRPGVAGRCELGEVEQGSQIRLDVHVKGPVLALGLRQRQRAAFAAALDALRERIGEVRAGRADSPHKKRKVLEVRELDDGLEILLHGQRFRLIRVQDEAAE
jgi:hypothetical protein